MSSLTSLDLTSATSVTQNSKVSASTSGCSSLTPSSASQQKEKKKKIIKKCLKELKSLLPPKREGGKRGIINTLQNVLKHMKQFKDDGNGGDNPAVDTELMGGGATAEFSVNLDNDRCPLYYAHPQDWFKIILSVKGEQVVEVSPNILDMLGYPKDYWLNQPFLDYVYKRDMVIICSQLSHGCKSNRSPITTVADLDMPDLDKEEMDGERRHFFFRLRHFKSLRQGFSLSRTEKFSVFCGELTQQKFDVDLPPGMPHDQKPADNVFNVLNCFSIKSAYLSWSELKPEEKCFSTRHTIYCNFNFIHPAAISLLGYLPQDIIGTSIFDYYHPDDLQMLHDVYIKVVNMPGQMFSCAPYRLKARNGDYILVKTDWSSFMNPWSKKLDLVFGKHVVLEVPVHLDVLTTEPIRETAPFVSQQAKAQQKMIKELLLQPGPSSCSKEQNKKTRSIEVLSPPCPAMPSEVQVTEQDNAMETQESTAALPSGSDLNKQDSTKMTNTIEVKWSESVEVIQETKPASQSEGTDREKPEDAEKKGRKAQSQLPLSDEDKALIYERFNYAQIVLRFLTSTKLQGETHARRATGDDNDDADPYSTKNIRMDVDLPIPKPPSFASSTKALVSEQEQREEIMPPSPVSKETMNEDLPLAAKEIPLTDTMYEHISLTKEVLKRHDALQEQYYIQKIVQNKKGFVTSGGPLRGQFQETPLPGVKRSQKEMEGKGPNSDAGAQTGEPAAKRHQATRSLLTPPFPLTEVTAVKKTPKVVPESSISAPPAPQPLPHSSSSYLPVAVSPSGSFFNMDHIGPMFNIPVISVGVTSTPSTMQPAAPVITQAAMTGLQWPYYNPQSGIQFMQPVFYQPAVYTSASQPQAPRKAIATVTSQSHKSAKVQIKDKPCQTAPIKDNSDSMSMEDTNSSLLYLLESNSSSHINGSNCEEQMEDSDKEKHPATVPPWLMNVEWTSDTTLKYQLPKQNRGLVLRQDWKAIQTLPQSPLVLEQLKELLGSQPPAAIRGLDEEADFLFTIEEDPESKSSGQEGEEDKDLAILLRSPLEEDISEQLPEEAEDIYYPMGGPPPEETKNTPDTDDTSIGIVMADTKELTEIVENAETIAIENSEISHTIGRTSPGKHGSDSDTSQEMSKWSSSDMTPSDLRSHDENISSIKESDLSDCGSSSKDLKENYTDGFTREELSKLFVPLKIEYSAKQNACWLLETDMSLMLQMTYHKPSGERAEVLSQDKTQLLGAVQPQLVPEQVKAMVNLRKELSNALGIQEEKSGNGQESGNGMSSIDLATSTEQDSSIPTISDTTSGSDSAEQTGSDISKVGKDSSDASGDNPVVDSAHPTELFSSGENRDALSGGGSPMDIESSESEERTEERKVEIILREDIESSSGEQIWLESPDCGMVVSDDESVTDDKIITTSSDEVGSMIDAEGSFTPSISTLGSGMGSEVNSGCSSEKLKERLRQMVRSSIIENADGVTTRVTAGMTAEGSQTMRDTLLLDNQPGPSQTVSAPSPFAGRASVVPLWAEYKQLEDTPTASSSHICSGIDMEELIEHLQETGEVDFYE